jgi:hypothetical protein
MKQECLQIVQYSNMEKMTLRAVLNKIFLAQINTNCKKSVLRFF